MTSEQEHLNIFSAIANECSVDECLEIIEDCVGSNDPFITGPVKNLYEKRLKHLQTLQAEIEHYEELYGG